VLQFVRAGVNYIDIPTEMVDGLQQFIEDVSAYLTHSVVASLFNEVVISTYSGNVGWPKLEITCDTLQSLLDTAFPLANSADMHGISRSTIYRRMKEHNMSVRECYSDMSDEELDQKVRDIKARMPHVGFRMVKGSLRAMGHRVQWPRVGESLQHVDGASVRMTELHCILRLIYSVPAPLSLVHIDTNHKWIRY
jgi:hypothetical protein